MDVLVVSLAKSNEQSLNPGINHYTQWGRLNSQFKGNDNVDYGNVTVMTDIYGRTLSVPIDSIVSSSSLRFPSLTLARVRSDADIKEFYHRDQTDQLTADGFVDIGDDNGLLTVGRIPLGTGIYGKYFASEADATKDVLAGEAIYRIDASECYTLIDGAHGDLLALASIFTNRYVAEALRNGNTTISTEELKQLDNLWYMVFAQTREEDKIDQQVRSVLNIYIAKYQQTSYLNIDARPVQLLPVNAILAKIGYQGIFATDSYNNSRDRGCVSYNINQATNYRVGHAQY